MKSFDPSQNDNPELFQYYYHSDHLGSTSLITNLDGEVVQHVEYIAFGEPFLEERNNTWNTPYLFNSKELDPETSLYYYGSRYYDPRISLWLSTDPLQEKYPSVSTYAYCIQNPVKFIDLDGMDWIVVSQGGDELRRVVDKRPDFYYKVNETAFNMVSSYYQESLGVTDNFNNTLLSIGGLMQIEQNWGVDGLVAKQTGIKIDITGEAERTGTTDKVGRDAYMAEGTMTLSAVFDNNSTTTLQTLSVNSGHWDYGPTPNGTYSASSIVNTSESGMVRDGVGFKVYLNDNTVLNRTKLRIHPDQVPSVGTAGCIGIVENAEELRTFRNSIQNYFKGFERPFNVNINFNNNPNYNNPTGGRATSGE